MELSILHFIQGMHTPAVDQIMVFLFNTIVGSKGQLWLLLGLALLLIPKTRKCGICVIVSFLLSFLIGDKLLKNLIARPRPCAVDGTVALIVQKPSGFSCPSVHTYLAFASATAVFYHYRKAGIAALTFAALVGFSRMYFFVHYPMDVLFGAVLGVLTAWITCCVFQRWFRRKKVQSTGD